MKILNSEQVRQADAYTIAHEPIASVDLMERASEAFTRIFTETYRTDRRVYIFCGTGNNGGDGLAIGRLLKDQGYIVEFFAIGSKDRASADFKINLERSEDQVVWLEDADWFPMIKSGGVIIDALFGSGLAREITGLYAELIEHLNNQDNPIVSVDIASGLYADQPVDKEAAIIQPEMTISFQVPKLAFFQPGLAEFVGDWHIVDIGLDQKFISKLESPFSTLEESGIKKILPRRSKFDHKGDAGKIILVTGSKGKIGASVLSARAAMRAGAGLLFIHTPGCASDVIHVSIPEAMIYEDEGSEVIENLKIPDGINAVGIGPGIGTHVHTAKTFEKYIQNLSPETRLVLDADSINLLTGKPDLLSKLPPESILTPHPGEFARLVGTWSDDYEKLEKLQALCKSHQLNIVLKGANSAICDSEGNISFNTTGNPGMATAGSGDVLLGIITALVGQGLNSIDALKLGVFIHGMAGDLAKQKVGELSLIASDLIDYLPAALRKLH